MSNKLTKDLKYTLDVLEQLVNIPSPSGFCHEISDFVEDKIKAFGYGFEKTMKGNPVITVKGNREETLLVSAHLDTLGGMVRSIKPNGMIRMTSIGSYMMQSIEGEYCTIHTRNGHKITGTILNTKPAVHVYKEARTQERTEEAMEVRLDEGVKNKKDVEALGIEVGDFISFDPRFVVTESGYIKSRHLDDKAGVAIILGLLNYLSENNITPSQTLKVMFSTYEEVSHGSSYIPADVSTVLAVDVGAIGDDLACTEKGVSICVKDSSGPYDYETVTLLKEIAEEQGLDYSLDVYPFYSSDASAALRAGHDIKAALIGAGVHALHTMERTHESAILNTLNLLIGYVLK